MNIYTLHFVVNSDALPAATFTNWLEVFVHQGQAQKYVAYYLDA